ncbi:MAG: HAD family hydrolase [Candidatus Poribacteria bacterium]|nr:HAD family hydrolase [Candidatus Poribacteria bacterium]
MPITTIIFDLDDTLMPEVPTVEAAYLETCRLAASRGVDPVKLVAAVQERARELWHGAPIFERCRNIGVSSWEGLWGDFSSESGALAYLRDWTPGYQRMSWSNALEDFGIRDEALATELTTTFRQNVLATHALFPDAEPVLTDLRRDHRFALLTNGASSVQREKIANVGIESRFDVIVVTGEFGVGKPDATVFYETLARMDATPQTTVMVGNSLERDIIGAKNAGLKSIWLNLDGQESVEPDATIRSLTELRAALTRLSA